MPDTENIVPTEYKYKWSKASDLSLDAFLAQFKPSMVQNDGNKPWIWVKRDDSPSKEDEDVDAAISEATELLKEVTKKVDDIRNDAFIPVRSNKKTGAKSKKEVREEVQAEATEKLKDVAIKHGYVSGKWLIFASADKVDTIWCSIATSLVSGPLSSTSAYLAKVATSPEQESPNYQHIICVYMPDIYDKDSVTEIMKVLLRNHGATLSGVKSNLYTSIGIDSKHASGIPSTAWKNTALMKDTEIKELKDAFFSKLTSKSESAAKPQQTDVEMADGEEKTSNIKPKPKLKAKKKGNDNPFASDDEDVKEKSPEPKPKATKGKPAPKASRKRAADDSDDEEDRKKALQAKKTASKPKPKSPEPASEDDNSETEEVTLAAKKKKLQRAAKPTNDKDEEPPKKRTRTARK